MKHEYDHGGRPELIRRRVLIAILGGTALGWPHVARAQQTAMPVIGFLHDQQPEASIDTLKAFRKGLAEQGFVEGRNVAIEFRWARGDYDRVPELAADLVRRHVAVIVAMGNGIAQHQAEVATATIPIVRVFGSDPTVDSKGRVSSLNHPGGNVTGAALFTGSENVLDAKRLDLLLMLLPGISKIGVLVGAFNTISDAQMSIELAAMEARGLVVKLVRVDDEEDFEPAFASLARENVPALLASPNAYFTSHRARLVALAARYRLPAIWEWPEFVELGGLMSYGARLTDIIYQVGIYAGRVLKGEKAGDLPVVLPDRFYLLINLKTAEALGIAIPPKLLALADEVVE